MCNQIQKDSTRDKGQGLNRHLSSKLRKEAETRKEKELRMISRKIREGKNKRKRSKSKKTNRRKNSISRLVMKRQRIVLK